MILRGVLDSLHWPKAYDEAGVECSGCPQGASQSAHISKKRWVPRANAHSDEDVIRLVSQCLQARDQCTKETVSDNRSKTSSTGKGANVLKLGWQAHALPFAECSLKDGMKLQSRREGGDAHSFKGHCRAGESEAKLTCETDASSDFRTNFAPSKTLGSTAD
eukprot:6367131-Pyramimonas_sp.AAC.1